MANYGITPEFLARHLQLKQAHSESEKPYHASCEILKESLPPEKQLILNGYTALLHITEQQRVDTQRLALDYPEIHEICLKLLLVKHLIVNGPEKPREFLRVENLPKLG